MNYQKLLQNEAARRGWTPEQVKMFEEWRYKVGQVESNNNPFVKQKGGGPGRGKYQYELAAGGGSGANKTAIKRFQQYLDQNSLSLDILPAKDRRVLFQKDPDFSRLSPETQDMIFLADKALAKETDLNDLVTGNIKPEEAWAKWHWKGKKQYLPEKLDQWKRNVGETPDRIDQWNPNAGKTRPIFNVVTTEQEAQEEQIEQEDEESSPFDNPFLKRTFDWWRNLL